MYKSKKEKLIEYEYKYGHIPKDYLERLNYLCESLKIDDAKADEIIQKRNNYIASTYYDTIRIVFYEYPEYTPRPRAKLINKKNVINAASGNNSFIRVYSIGARDNKEYVQMFAKQNLRYLEQLLCTPCDIEYRVYYPTPVEYTKLDVFLAEIGVHRPLCKPDFDNIEKSYSDAFSGNIWIDDIVVIDATIRKFFSILPRVEIDLKYANQLSNRYHYRNMTNRKDFTKEMKVSYFGGKTNDDESV